jgi:hypothetical protein
LVVHARLLNVVTYERFERVVAVLFEFALDQVGASLAD